MANYLNFGMFLTTLAIVSVVHAELTDSEITQSSKSPSLPKVSKTYNSEDKPILATMPEEIPVMKYPYVKPKGLDGKDVQNIRSQVFNQANMYRKRHGCTPFTLNAHMNNHAQDWANHLATTGDIRSRTVEEDGIYGQTIYTTASSSEDMGKTAVDTWYNELRFIKEGDNGDDLFNNPNDIGFLVQLLWKKSKQMGIGVAKSSTGDFIIVADYSPKGVLYYPFSSDNLPKFTQKHINAAQNAHQASQNKNKSIRLMSNNGNTIILPTQNDLRIQQQRLNEANSKLSELSNRFSDYLDQDSGLNFVKKLNAPSMYYDDNDDDDSFSEESYESDDSWEIPEQEHTYVKPIGIKNHKVNNICEQVFKQVNMYRQRHGFSPLTLNKKINNHAQYWANYVATSGDLRTRTTVENGIYGQTIYTTTSFENIGITAVDTWYNQLRYIKRGYTEDDLFNNPNVIGFMMQLLWKDSKEMGVGVAKSSNGAFVVVAEYNPRGVIYPLLLKNLPKFTQKQINEAKKAHRILKKKTFSPQQKSQKLLKKIRDHTLNQRNPNVSYFTNSHNIFSGTVYGNAPTVHDNNVDGSSYWTNY